MVSHIELVGWLDPFSSLNMAKTTLLLCKKQPPLLLNDAEELTTDKCITCQSVASSNVLLGGTIST
jgi:hypothetical protein